MFNYCAYTQKGSGHKVNEDRIIVDGRVLTQTHCSGSTVKSFFAAVCDGVGGVSGGDLAADMVAKSLVRFNNCDYVTPATFGHHLRVVNSYIALKQKENMKYSNMASTVAGISISNNKYVLFNLGDTRIYKYHDGKLSKITRDHIAQGGLERDHNIITRYLGGYGNACCPSYNKGNSENGSLFLLCSDGVYKGQTEDEIKRILGNDCTLEEKEKAILELSLQNGSTDDMSLVIVRCVARDT